ncbi:MAG: hypothetical protein EZS28_001636 [Streblomastix strix]|uniref:Uncharacterized protein n=1 Tax=Streblomastix strix TaxID=222440 RepID=A0A5J4X6N0_9EUKA|nr:MAG: hypothetical protein EZS28_001636 [Streblomastix strix]
MPYVIFLVVAAVESSTALKLTLPFKSSEHVYIIEQIAVPLAANGARVYLTPADVSKFTGESKNYCLEIAKDYT